MLFFWLGLKCIIEPGSTQGFLLLKATFPSTVACSGSELTDLSSLLCPQVFGGLVWILVASTRVYPGNPLGWVMFVSIFCFVMTTLFFFLFILGHNQKKIWNYLVGPSHDS